MGGGVDLVLKLSQSGQDPEIVWKIHREIPARGQTAVLSQPCALIFPLSFNLKKKKKKKYSGTPKCKPPEILTSCLTSHSP